MPEDITIAEEEVEFELPTPHEDIAAAYNALAAIEGVDLEMIPKVRKQKILAIQRMSIEIIHEQIKYIHSCIFFDEKEEEE